VFIVQGYIDGISYAVQVGVDHQVMSPRALGIVNGSPSAIQLLVDSEGLIVSVTPTGPSLAVSLTDPAGVLAALIAGTEVTSVEGDDVPDLVGSPKPGLVY
jgi:hypothetical protein